MNKGLLRLGIAEARLEAFVQDLAPDESACVRRSVEEAFGGKAGSHGAGGQTYAWSRFRPSSKSWTDVVASIDLALRSAGAWTDRCWLFEEEWRNELVLKARTDAVRRIVKEAWYPSDDLYICDEHFRWCLVLTHHDVILLYEAEKAGNSERAKDASSS